MQEEIFEKYPIPKAYFKLALPVVFSMVISLVYNMVDTYFIAGTGNTAVSYTHLTLPTKRIV